MIRARRDATILNNMLQTTIRWPSPADLPTVAAAFNDPTRPDNFPGIIGALDGSHIPISTPTNSPDSYINRKKFHSVILQATVDSTCSFTDVSVGSPGRMHDAQVFRNSSMSQLLYQNTAMGQYHIIADAAYPLMKCLLTPFRNVGHLTHAQHTYNTALSVRRQVVERAFGMYKQRFH